MRALSLRLFVDKGSASLNTPIEPRKGDRTELTNTEHTEMYAGPESSTSTLQLEQTKKTCSLPNTAKRKCFRWTKHQTNREMLQIAQKKTQKEFSYKTPDVFRSSKYGRHIHHLCPVETYVVL